MGWSILLGATVMCTTLATAATTTKPMPISWSVLLGATVMCTTLATAATTTKPMLQGIFVTMYEQDVAFTAARWEEELREMKAIGIHTIIVGETASHTWPNYSISTPVPGQRVRVPTFWPTRLGSSVPGYTLVDTGYAPLEYILSGADVLNMSVILGNADVPWVDQGGAQDWKMQAALSKAILAELWDLYKHHPSLSGFYNVVELSCDVRNEKLGLQIAKEMFAPFADQVKALRPSLRAVTSPYYRPAGENIIKYYTCCACLLGGRSKLSALRVVACYTLIVLFFFWLLTFTLLMASFRH